MYTQSHIAYCLTSYNGSFRQGKKSTKDIVLPDLSTARRKVIIEYSSAPSVNAQKQLLNG